MVTREWAEFVLYALGAIFGASALAVLVSELAVPIRVASSLLKYYETLYNQVMGERIMMRQNLVDPVNRVFRGPRGVEMLRRLPLLQYSVVLAFYLAAAFLCIVALHSAVFQTCSAASATVAAAVLAAVFALILGVVIWFYVKTATRVEAAGAAAFEPYPNVETLANDPAKGEYLMRGLLDMIRISREQIEEARRRGHQLLIAMCASGVAFIAAALLT